MTASTCSCSSAKTRAAASMLPSPKSFCKTSACSPSTKPFSTLGGWKRRKEGCQDRLFDAYTQSKRASWISLAEQIGELSLIPRNPDDDEAADWTEYTVDDFLMAVGEKNSRQKEQGITDTRPAGASARGALPVEEKPNVIVAAPEASQRTVSDGNRRSPRRSRSAVRCGDTRRVNSALGRQRHSPRMAQRCRRPPKPAADHATTPQGEAAKTLEDFPIKFDSDKG